MFFRELSPLLFAERVTLVWATNPIWLTTIDTGKNAISLVGIPSEIYVEVPGGFGSYRLGVLWRLGKVENQAGKILASSIQKFLGAPVDGWIGFGDSTLSVDGGGEEIINRLATKISPLAIFNPTIDTNLSKADRLLIWWWLYRLPTRQLLVVDLGKKNITEPRTLADGSQVQFGNPELVDKLSQQLFWEDTLKGETLVFRVYNGSGITGLGNDVARLLTNIGLHVVGVGNSDLGDECRLLVPDTAKRKKSIRRVAQIFNCSILPQMEVSQEVQLFIGRQTNSWL